MIFEQTTVQFKTVRSTTGNSIAIATVTYLLNPIQGVTVIGYNDDHHDIQMKDSIGAGATAWLPIGRFESIPLALKDVILPKLKASKWNFFIYPNPLLYLGTYIGDEPIGKDLPPYVRQIMDQMQQNARLMDRFRNAKEDQSPGRSNLEKQLLANQGTGKSLITQMLLDKLRATFGVQAGAIKHADMTSVDDANQYLDFPSIFNKIHGFSSLLNGASTILLGATVSGYIDDELNEEDLMKQIESDRERALACGLITSVWELYYSHNSTKLDHNAQKVAGELYGARLTKQEDFDAFREKLMDEPLPEEEPKGGSNPSQLDVWFEDLKDMRDALIDLNSEKSARLLRASHLLEQAMAQVNKHLSEANA